MHSDRVSFGTQQHNGPTSVCHVSAHASERFRRRNPGAGERRLLRGGQLPYGCRLG
jgi:hypothetical protein